MTTPDTLEPKALEAALSAAYEAYELGGREVGLTDWDAVAIASIRAYLSTASIPQAERETRQLAALRELQVKAGDMLGQLTSNHPWYRVFEDMHRVAAGAQLASLEGTNSAAKRKK